MKRKYAVFFILILGLAAGWLLLSLGRTFQSALAAYNEGRQAWEAIKKQDIVKAEEKLKETRVKLLTTRKNLAQSRFIKFIPIIGNYYGDGERFLNAGLYALDSGEVLIEAIKPYVDILGLKGQGSFVLGSAEERIQKLVQTMDKIVPSLGGVSHKVDSMKKEIEGVNPNRYPNIMVRGIKIKSELIRLQKLVDELNTALIEAKPVLEALPGLLGEPETVKYLILFQNDKELRPTGGFITAYAIFRLEHGKIFVEKSDDIYKLDRMRIKKVPPPEPILKYLPDVGGGLAKEWNMRDANLSPDFFVSMQEFEKFYDQIPGKEKIKGIIGVDTHVLLKAMEILGPITIYGTKFTTDIVPYCNCPQVIYELERYADQPVNYERGSRKDLIGQLLYAIMQQALKSSPKVYWGALFQTGLREIAEKHVLFYLKDEKAQKGMEFLNAAGRIKEYGGDYLLINEANFGGAKANMFISEEVEQKIELGADGTFNKTLAVNYKNPFPGSDCKPEHGQLCLNAPLRNWLRFYVPLGSVLLDSKGSEVKMTSTEDLGKTVFEGFLTIRPQGSARIEVKYKLPFKINKGQEYKLYIQKQPGTEGHQYTINAFGKTENFKLITDREFGFRF